MDLSPLDRIPKLQCDAFLALAHHAARMEANEIGYETDEKRAHPPGDAEAGEIFAVLLYDVGRSRDIEMWPGWEQWAGPYAQKCYTEESVQLLRFAGKIMTAVLIVLLAAYGYGAWKGSFAEMPWLPLAGAAWILFSVVGIVGSLSRWFRFRGTDWPLTPEAARAWRKARQRHYGDRL